MNIGQELAEAIEKMKIAAENLDALRSEVAAFELSLKQKKDDLNAHYEEFWKRRDAVLDLMLGKELSST